MLDIILRGGLIYDGTGSPPISADIGIKGDRIVEIGNLDQRDAHRIFDVTGKSILPGMIDVHTHTDMRHITNPDRCEALMQGITTEITGACGIGVFPLAANSMDYLNNMKAILGNQVQPFASCEEYFSTLPHTGTNVAVQAAHSPLRMAAVGFQCSPLSEKQFGYMKDLLHKAFSDGACGLSTGLAYFPAAYADTDEVAGLCKVASAYDAPVSVHQRTVFRTPQPGFDSREEVLEFARKSNAKLQFSHYRTAASNINQTDKLLEPIKRGRKEGLKLTADFYPYPVGSGYTAAVLPMWAMDGGWHSTISKLKDPALRKRLLQDIKQTNPILFQGIVTHVAKHSEYIGLSYQEIAYHCKCTVEEAILDLLCEESLNAGYRLDADCLEAVMEQQEKDCICMITEPFYMLGSDTLPSQMFPHPRSYGAFARMLRLCVKHNVDLSLFANRTAGFPAKYYHLKDRGTIKAGSYSDLYVCDPTVVSEHATFEQPKQFASGIELVLVNGCIAVQDGKITGILAGRPIRRDSA